nr:hypothetical protein [Tanacetum cinerariifolium]
MPSKRKKPKDKAEYSSKPDHAECSSKLETKKNGRTSEAIKERWTMGRDENNQMHPLALVGYGGGLTVLSDGHKDNWVWFISMLQEDLELGYGSYLSSLGSFLSFSGSKSTT